ncbi:unnamed protein product (macronuclear) [Paramecium tetraurelia]|uniref:Septin-type G domain-containing protein n=1 Tax=Paramecium tetraurelia TaxID=5888 RepID=A0BNM0_PARTE|nr:uncharacterized protein GSPATT00030775001 [Paramecium tetraurelia]CAK60137.1 unnamed protein product [Paramecium tetraurelia]|eukprot:XP_001427535.1 hypothetical protein (macronuclear) [Paramecium tetraurelia strain d4-2]
MEQNNVTFYKHPMIQQRDLKDQSILKTLVVIGETGVGKSTMINFSAITILDSNMQIHLDLQLLMKNKYNNYIKGLDGNSTLRIIDTPGFRATRGYEEDEKISNLITTKLQPQIRLL